MANSWQNPRIIQRVQRALDGEDSSDGSNSCSGSTVSSDSGVVTTSSSATNYASTESDWGTESGESTPSPVDGPQVAEVHIHAALPPVPYGQHQPPLQFLATVFQPPCNCRQFGLPCCAQENDFLFFAQRQLNFVEEHQQSVNTAHDPLRKPNNRMRKKLYKRSFYALNFGVHERGERRRLPKCVEARVRQIYPSTSGIYMGFQVA